MDQEKTYKWVQDRLHDLHSGTISDADRIRLEEMAKSDPFIADAIEGYQAHANHDHSPLLKVIAQRIKNKNAERRPKLLPLSRGLVLQAVAASFVLILATWAVIYYVQKQNDTTLVAAESADTSSIEHSTEVELTYPDSSNGEIAGNMGTADELNDEPSGLRANAYAKAEAEAKAKEKNEAKMKENAIVEEDDKLTLSEPVMAAPASMPPTTYEDNTVIEEQSTREKETEKMAAGSIPDKSVSKKDEGYYANQMNPALMSIRVTGKVINDFGEPLQAARISIQNTTLYTITDQQGQFEFNLPEVSSTIEVTYDLGFVDTSLIVSRGQQDLNIVLKEKESRTTIPPGAIIDLNNDDLRKAETKNELQGLEKQFLYFIEINSRFPIQHNFTSESKSVKVEFNIKSKGRPENINMIVSSADSKYISEAMRLIQKGPDWMCEDDVYPCRKEYTFYFK